MKKLAGYFFGVVGTFTIFAGFFSYTYAQTNVVCPEGKYCALTTIPGATEAGKVANPTDVIKRIYSISIGIAAILAVIMIIWGGIQYATTEAMSGKSDAKDHIQSAFLGLLILVGSYLILKTINSQLVNIKLDLGMSKIESGVPAAGGDVFNKMLSNVMADVSKKTNVLDVAKKNTQSLETKISERQSEINQLKIKLLVDADPANSITKLKPAELTALNDQIKSLELLNQQDGVVLEKAQVVLASESINQRLSSISEIVISKALSQDDALARGDAISNAKRSMELMQQDLELLRKNPSATPEDIRLATLRLSVANVSTSRVLEAANTINSTKSGAGRITIDQRGTFINDIKGIADAGISGDPTNALSYSKQADLAIQAYDKALAQKLGCSNGIIAGTVVICKP